MSNNTKLKRNLGLSALLATGICSMLGASINVVPFMIQRNVHGIDSFVLPAFIFAMIPALFAALAYGALSSAMPRAGGSYIYASRGLNPYLGFIASFSQWFGLSIVIGVIAYICVSFIRDVVYGLGFIEEALLFELPIIKTTISLLLIWIFVFINIQGINTYKKTLLPMMYLMFFFGFIVIIAGFYFNANDFVAAVEAKDNKVIEINSVSSFDWRVFLSASALLFSSFIGFDSIAQAGSEAKNPSKTLPRAILLAILSVGCFYFLFTSAVYNTVPWSYVAEESQLRDISAPGLMSYVLPSWLGVAIVLGAAIALINDLPAMLLSVSRLMFAWAEDGIFPSQISKIHPKNHTPHIALIMAGFMASIGALGSQFAGDFFLGIDIMVTSMMVNFLLMCVTLIAIPKVNPLLANKISVIKNRNHQLIIGVLGVLFLTLFLAVHTFKDMTSDVSSWFFRSTPVWLIVMGLGSLIFSIKWREIGLTSEDQYSRFKSLPKE
jgi:amino acid transporter|tara:strand:- start:3027 stop:4508 length:1482 start_codon:yes stop_codon:yes gene_type:complete